MYVCIKNQSSTIKHSRLEQAPSWFIDGWLSSHCVLTWQKGMRELSGVSSVRALGPIMRTPPLWPHSLSKIPPPNTVILGIRFQHVNLGIEDYQVMMRLGQSRAHLCSCSAHCNVLTWTDKRNKRFLLTISVGPVVCWNKLMLPHENRLLNIQEVLKQVVTSFLTWNWPQK